MATRMQQRRGTAAAWAAANPVLADGEIGFEHDTGVIKVGDGVTAWLALPAPYVTRSLVDAKGDIFVGTADNTVARLAAGAVGQRLTVQADGSLAWQAPSVDIPASIEDVKGDLIVGTGADTYARLAVGTDGMLPVADSTQAAGIAWKDLSPAWTAYVPLTDFWNNASFGYGVTAVTGAYLKVGKKVNFRIKVVTNGTAAQAGNPAGAYYRFSLPVVPKDLVVARGFVMANATNFSQMPVFDAVYGPGIVVGSLGNCGSTLQGRNWNVADVLIINGSYEST